MTEVSFFTNCYEGDWRSLLKTNRLENIIKSCQYEFDFKGLIINNVKNKEEVESFARKHVDLGIIDAYYFSDDLNKTILNFFKIKRSSFYTDFCDGYWYSIAPLTAIYLCKTTYLLYLTCDCEILPHQINWIEKGKNILSEDVNFVVNPIWTYQPELAKEESLIEFDTYFKNHGFSDQCFLIKSTNFKLANLNEHHISSDRYPVYSGHSFERRINSFMRNHGLYRIVLKQIAYEHTKILDTEIVVSKKSLFRDKIPPLSRRIKHKLNKYLHLNIK